MKQVFINLPVNDIEQSKIFYMKLGFGSNELFSGQNQKCMVWDDHIYVMLQTKMFFGSVIKKPIQDNKNFISSSFTLPVESLEIVNQLVEKGLKAGGTEPIPMIDEGFMQVRTIEDLDGHTWGIIYLDIEKFSHQKK